MFSKKLLFLVFSMAVGFSCQAMEEQQPEMLKIKCIGVKCIGGKISIPKHIAEQAKAVRDCFSDSEEDQGNIVKVKHLDISKATAEKVFDCIRNKRNIKELQPNEINEVFEVADALGVPQWCLRKLTLRGKKILVIIILIQ